MCRLYCHYLAMLEKGKYIWCFTTNQQHLPILLNDVAILFSTMAIYYLLCKSAVIESSDQVLFLCKSLMMMMMRRILRGGGVEGAKYIKEKICIHTVLTDSMLYFV